MDCSSYSFFKHPLLFLKRLYYCQFQDFLYTPYFYYINRFDIIKKFTIIPIALFNVLFIYVLIKLYKTDKKVTSIKIYCYSSCSKVSRKYNGKFIIFRYFQLPYYSIICYMELCSCTALIGLIPCEFDTLKHYELFFKPEDSKIYSKFQPSNLPIRFIQLADFYLCLQRFLAFFDLNIHQFILIR